MAKPATGRQCGIRSNGGGVGVAPDRLGSPHAQLKTYLASGEGIGDSHVLNGDHMD